MWKGLLSVLGLVSVLLPSECTISVQSTNIKTLMKGTLDHIDLQNVKNLQKSITAITNIDASWIGKINILTGGTTLSAGKPDVIPLPKAPTKATLAKALNAASAKVKADDITDKEFSKFDTPNNKTEAFGPQLLTTEEAIKISKPAQIIIETAKNAMKTMKIAKSQRKNVLSRVPAFITDEIKETAGCRFIEPDCNLTDTSPYRTADGSCNNLDNGLWGKSHTPFERFIPSFYEDGLDDPRATDVFGDPLPGARGVSINVHTDSDGTTQMNDLSHFSMEFGQFVSHDIQMNALSKGRYMSNLNCCLAPNRRNCFKIPLPTDDPFYSAFNRTCMNFVRALPTTDLDCSVGPRQQLNQNTHFLDGSAVYGSNLGIANSLREFVGGRLQSTNGELLPKDIPNTSSCILPPSPSVKCFKAGDPRVNQQPALMALQTIWMKEHNRIANEFTLLNGWNDEKVYQEARKIVGAIIQHVTYNEYLPHILGNTAMADFELQPNAAGYFTGYDPTIKPQIRNSFSAAAFRFGHSQVRQRLAYNGPAHPNVSPLLHNEFLRPDKLYDINGGVSSITRGLYEEFSQKVDRKITKELTERLFERIHGFGNDLAAINVQRGRDHGLASYNVWRSVCGLVPADDFTPGVSGGLEHHNTQAAQALELAYRSTWDIDLFAGGVSETPINGGKVGPTFECIIGLQFRALKFGDRFFYESDTDVKFTPDQLIEIKQATMARIICQNTNINSLPADVFQRTSASNPEVNCASLPTVDLQKWQKMQVCIDGEWSAFRKINKCMQRRICNNPKPNKCGKSCVGSPIKIKCPKIKFPKLKIGK